MMQLVATCKRCQGTGYDLSASSLVCEECGGRGMIILTEEKWDIALTDKPKARCLV